MDDKTNRIDLLTLTTEIVSAHVSNHKVTETELTMLIKKVFITLEDLSTGSSGIYDRPEPAVPVKDSITPDHLICLEDGKKLKMLKRYLKTAHGMTPEEYREKWGLPPDYPMVAPNYAKQRSALAKEIGLGTTRTRGDEA